MDVDHHNPTLRRKERNNYENLLLATRHCNGKKGKCWPTETQLRAGIKFINPCEEQDYGVHIFEDPITFRLWGATPQGVWQVYKLGLNAAHLVQERCDRSRLRAAMNMDRYEIQIVPPQSAKVILDGIQTAKMIVERMIPPFVQKREPGKT